MSKTSTGYACGVAFFGASCLFVGIGIITCAGMLSNVVAGITVNEAHTAINVFNVSDILLFERYWVFAFYVSRKLSILSNFTYTL